MGILQDIGGAIGTAAGTATGSWLKPVLSIIDKIIPDPAAKAQAQLAVLQLEQAGQLAEEQTDLQLALSQNEVNQTEASSASFFRSGWRPAAGWTCACGLCYQYLAQPLFAWISLLAHVPVPPVLDVSTLVSLLFGMLGLGTHRTIEKLNGLS